jgi:hypothetical protein
MSCDWISAVRFSVSNSDTSCGWRIHVATDGEVVRLRAPLFYRSRPGALRVVLPSL